MNRINKALLAAIALLAVAACQSSRTQGPNIARIEAVKSQRLMGIKSEMNDKGFALGSPIFIRIFKKTSEFEIWVKNGKTYSLYKNYPICKFSGVLGPKLKEGDRQAPEGVYNVGKSQLNPNSDYHLAFNLGFPNEYDQSLGRTGSFLMVHGNCLSVGCYAMTDYAIEEIYIIVEAALNNGQKNVPVLALPFRYEKENQELLNDEKWGEFWRELANINTFVENEKIFPNIIVKEGHYVIAQ